MNQLRPYDPVIALYLGSLQKWNNYEQASEDLMMSPSMIFNAVKRLRYARLVSDSLNQVNQKALGDFIQYGVPYSFADQPMEVTVGIPTSWGCPALKPSFNSAENTPDVWAHKDGKIRGYRVEPLHKNFPDACLKNEKIYNYCGLIDAIRVGRAREKKIAIDLIKEMLNRGNSIRPAHL